MSERISSSADLRVWVTTLIALGLVLALDFFFAYRNRHRESSLKSVASWTALYIAGAIAFGVGLGIWGSGRSRTEFFAGWITEYSLSFDNLFVLLLIMKSMKVEKSREDSVLFGGIVASLLLRGLFVAGGAELISHFEWIFYIFGGFLIYTAAKLFFESEHSEWKEGPVLRFVRARGVSLSMAALLAIASTNLVFAFDSIPAIFGLTHNLYVIVTATIFASMGLRQLYFLIGDLMGRLVYLNEGLSVILGFIGFKLLLEAAVGEGHSRVAGVKLPNISLGFSLGFVIAILTITTLLSLWKSARRS
jgi:tellurite resistance protein TerC